LLFATRKRSSVTARWSRHIDAMRLDDLKKSAIRRKNSPEHRAVCQWEARQQCAVDGLSWHLAKSSLIKACLNEYSARGLRLIEVDKADLVVA
jgi:hypothetical protein